MRLELPGVEGAIELSEEDLANTPKPVLAALTLAIAAITKLAARVSELEEKLNATSRNSSLPPSKDPPGTLRSPKRPSGKNHGGQKGHRGVNRALVPPEQVTETRNFTLPDHCPDCACELPTEREIRRRQIWEVPKIVPQVLEIRQECATCPGCRKALTADLGDLPKGDFGPNLVALVGILQGRFTLSHRDCQELLAQLTGIKVGLGTIPRLCRLASRSLADFHSELHTHLQSVPVLNADDTAWKLGTLYKVMFSLNTPDAAFFKIEDRKDHKTVQRLLGDFSGCLGVDRASTYSCYSGRLQHCLAHLDRHFLRIWDRGGPSRPIGAQGRKEMDRLWAAWRSFKEGEIDRPALQAKLKPIRARVGRLLKSGADCTVLKTARTCKRLLKTFASMWSFADLSGVEPTNNISEQAVRQGVVWRRTSFFSQSEAGLRFTERILSAVLTCARRGHGIWDFMAKQCSRIVGDLSLRASPA